MLLSGLRFSAHPQEFGNKKQPMKRNKTSIFACIGPISTLFVFCATSSSKKVHSADCQDVSCKGGSVFNINTNPNPIKLSYTYVFVSSLPFVGLQSTVSRARPGCGEARSGRKSKNIAHVRNTRGSAICGTFSP